MVLGTPMQLMPAFPADLFCRDHRAIAADNDQRPYLQFNPVSLCVAPAMIFARHQSSDRRHRLWGNKMAAILWWPIMVPRPEP